jgi:hypothetical protein
MDKTVERYNAIKTVLFEWQRPYVADSKDTAGAVAASDRDHRRRCIYSGVIGSVVNKIAGFDGSPTTEVQYAGVDRKQRKELIEKRLLQHEFSIRVIKVFVGVCDPLIQDGTLGAYNCIHGHTLVFPRNRRAGAFHIDHAIFGGFAIVV